MPDAPRARDRRERVLGVLVAHGLTAAGAEALWRVGTEVRTRTLQTKREFGAFVDAETGAPCGDVVSGSGDRLEAGLGLRAMIPGQQYAGVHTHPEGFSFSVTDVTVLVAHAPALRAIAVVGGHGVWYVLSVDPHRGLPAPAEVLLAFEREEAVVAPTYRQRVQAGGLTRREAQRAYTHEVWERCAPVLGLRYDRV
jgi:hypothetical protein